MNRTRYTLLPHIGAQTVRGCNSPITHAYVAGKVSGTRGKMNKTVLDSIASNLQLQLGNAPIESLFERLRGFLLVLKDPRRLDNTFPEHICRDAFTWNM